MNSNIENKEHNNLLSSFFIDANSQFLKMTIQAQPKTVHPYMKSKLPIDKKQQSITQQPKNYIQKLYEIKKIHPITIDLISSKGPAHKPEFEMKLTFNSNIEKNIFISNGVSKKQAKLNACKEALKYLTDLEPNERQKYLTELDVIEIKSLFLQELGDLSTLSTNSKTQEPSLFYNDLNNTKNLFTNFQIPKKINYSNSTNPVCVFTELLPNEAYKFKFVDEWGESHAKQFKIQLIINLSLIKIAFNKEDVSSNNNEKIFYATGNSKKQAKTRVTQIALDSLFNIKIDLNKNLSQNLVNDVKFKNFANNISDLIKENYLEYNQKLNLTNGCSSTSSSVTNDNNNNNDFKLRTVYASIIQTNDLDLSLDKSKIICITSGTKCINGEYMSLNGQSLNDCHAEILACRLLKTYLYEQLDIYVSYLIKKFNQEISIDEMINDNFIFEIKDDYEDDDDDDEGGDYDDDDDHDDNKKTKNLFCLKDNIRFHLFISTTPCGDGRIFAPHENHDGIDNHPNRKIRGLLRAKLESGEGTIPVGNEIKIQSWDAVLHGDRLKVMSCSDKLCKLNIVGVQGALLSHFIDAIYFNSVIIGSYFHYDHLSRALYGRIEEHLNKLPNNYKINKPIITPITNADVRQLSKSSNKAYIWSELLLNIKQEIINTKDGKQIDTKLSSNICKYELFKKWINIYKKLNDNKKYFKLNENICDLKEFSYVDIKQKSINYQKVKINVYEAFRKAALGSWITKPFEQDFFDI